MSAITDIKCALTRKALDAFCTKYYISDEVHPVLPNQNDTMHERPARKIGLYTIFFDYANFRLPLSVFLVDVLRHFRINISQLSVIGAAKVSHFEILCRVYEVIPTNDHFFWVDDFACLASFLWHTAKNVTRDPTPVAADFNAQDYATLVAYPSPFWKFPEAFLCLVGLSRCYPLDEETYPRFLHKNREDMDIFAFIHTPDPTKVKIVERERNEDEPLLLQTTVGRTVPLLPIAPDRAESELEASVDKLETADTVAEDVAPVQPKRHKKRKTMVVDAGEASHPPKKLRDDHETPNGPSVAGKSRSALKRLLNGAVLNPEVGVAAMPTLPFVTASVFVISLDSSHHSGANVAEAEVDSLVSADSSFAGGRADPITGVFSDLTGSDFLVSGIRTVIDPNSDLQKVYVPQWSVTNGSHFDDGRVCHEMIDEFSPLKFFASIRGMEHGQLFTEFNVGATRQMSLSAEVRMCAEYNIKEKRRLKSVINEQANLLKVKEREIENLKAQLALKEAEAAKAIRLRDEASRFEFVEKSLQEETQTLKEGNAILERERAVLDAKVTDLKASVVGKGRELAGLNAQLTSVRSQNDNLVDQVHELEVSSVELQEKLSGYENLTERIKEFQDAQLKIVNDKFEKLHTDFVEMTLHLEEKFYPHLLTTISCRRWLLTHGMDLAIAKCLNLPEYLSALGAAIGKAIEKGMQNGLSIGITHGKEGRVLIDVAVYNPSAEVDYVSALQQLQNVNFSLLAELKTNKDASVETLMNILRLEEALAERLGLSESQPHVDQLMVPIHHSPDKTVVGASTLSLALDVSSIRVQKIRENIANHRSVLRDVFVPLAEPFSTVALTSMEGTSNTADAAVNITMALSTTLASTSSVPPISIDDYEVADADGQVVADENVASFLNVDDADLSIPQ
ncbi:hypothetical protein Tco_0677585 [Tanacetum coccineum]|uniref:Transposase (Putative), gypsy type n=1 Tax=Tanacetum coccineum TaxID=301880 RepID=A0ABQ4XCU5_9ASTR